MYDDLNYYLFTAAASVVLLLTVGASARAVWPYVRRSVPGARCVAVGAVLLAVLPAAVLLWSVSRTVNSPVIPKWWFATPKTPQVVLLTAGCVVAYQVLLAVGLWRAWRAYDAAEEDRLVADRERDIVPHASPPDD